MITAAPQALEAPNDSARARRFSFELAWPHAVVAALAGISLFLGLSNITSQGFANYYYAAAVRSMMQNWHAFYFVSLDSKGFVSIDKPPLGFWVQTISALLFGYHGWSLLLPQALAGAGSVILVYAIVNRFFGAAAGMIAALAMTISPINVAVARNNTPDGLLVVTLLASALCFSLAIQRGRMVWLLAAFALIGVGFNIKMMEAYLILPGMVVTHLLASHSSFWRRVGHLAIASLVLAIVSFSWATTVWFTPANRRPYVGSTKNNNIFSLIFGYNGINRLLPKGWSIFGITNGAVSLAEVSARTVARPTSASSENGPQGLFRLFDHQLGGQIGWLIPLALVGLLAAWGVPRMRKLDGRHAMLLMAGIWAAVEIAFFSEAGFYHRYYLATLSPPIAILTGIGVVALWRQLRSSSWSALLLPAALAASIAAQLHVLEIYPYWKSLIEPLLIGGLVAASITVVVMFAVRGRPQVQSARFVAALSLCGAICLLTPFTAPAVWSYATIERAYEGALPIAGPDAQLLASSTHAKAASQSASLETVTHARLSPKSRPTVKATNADPGRVIMAFLNAHRGGAEFLVAVPSSREADPIIVNTGEPVMALGGFWGSDPILSVKSLRGLIESKAVRFFLIQGNDASLAANLAALTSRSEASTFGSRTLSEQSVSAWVEKTCPLVPPATIAASTPGASVTGLTGLYDCKGKGA